MKLSDTQKGVYWFALFITITIFIFFRRKPLLVGPTTEMDTTLFLVWIVILFFPLVSEISFLGFSYKKEMDALKTELSGKILDLRSEIQNSINVISRNTQELHFYMGPPSSEKKLDTIDESFQLVSGQAITTPSTTTTTTLARPTSSTTTTTTDNSLTTSTTIPPDYRADEDRTSFFEFRYALELHISDIWERYFDIDNKPRNIMQQLQILFNNEIIGPIYFQTYKESYAICTSVIHGADYTEKQYDFVKNNVIKLIENFEDIAKY